LDWAQNKETGILDSCFLGGLITLT